MTTELGIPSKKSMRRYIDTVERRIIWLETKTEEKKALGLPAGYEEVEREALKWAVAIMEAEYDHQLRLVERIKVSRPR